MATVATTTAKVYDLEERTFRFAQDCRAFVKRLPKTLANYKDGGQLIAASGSVAANYIEANKALSKKDFLMRIKISRKEAKESRLWLRLADTGPDDSLNAERQRLLGEATELMMIFGSMVRKNE